MRRNTQFFSFAAVAEERITFEFDIIRLFWCERMRVFPVQKLRPLHSNSKDEFFLIPELINFRAIHIKIVYRFHRCLRFE